MEKIQMKKFLNWQAASSYMLSYLLELNGYNTSMYNKSIVLHSNGLRYFGNTNISYVRLNNKLKFTSVRHPLSR